MALCLIFLANKQRENYKTKHYIFDDPNIITMLICCCSKEILQATSLYAGIMRNFDPIATTCKLQLVKIFGVPCKQITVFW